MAKSGNWQASLLEQRIAWAVATVCLILVLLTSTRPAWFDFSTSGHKPVARHAATTPVKHAIRKTNAPIKKAPPALRAVSPPKQHTVHSKTKQAPTKKVITVARGFYIQLGAFNERPRAQGLADRLQHQGWHTVIASTQGGLHAVWIGPKPTRRAAETLLKAVQARLKNKGFIVHH